MEKYIKAAKGLRKLLHAIPEESMREEKTKKLLIDWLKANTSLKIVDMGSWFYAVNGGTGEATAFRTDMDAVKTPEGVCRHVCGHDGHAAVIAALAEWVSDHPSDKKTVFVFQPGEETGEGAKLACGIIEKENVKEIYGFHNLPGEQLGTVLVKKGTFACASTGLEITLRGKPSHAAYPENGVNPAKAVCEMIMRTDEYVRGEHDGIVLSTVIGIDLGSASYGVSASGAVLRLTVRAEHQREFDALLDFIYKKCESICLREGISWNIREIERFPSTENDDMSAETVRQAAEKQGLKVAELDGLMRWSEDFGYYLQKARGCFFGIGAGHIAELHTDGYEFNDEVIPFALKVFTELAKETE